MNLTSRLIALGAAGCALAYAGCNERDVEPEAASQAREVQTRDDVWITTGRDTLPTLSRLQGSAPVVYGSSDDDDAPVAVRVPRSLLPRLSEAAHEDHHRCGGFMLHEDEQEALQFASGPAIEKQTVSNVYRIDNRETVTRVHAALSETELLATVRKLSSFPTRHHASATGMEAARWLHQTWASLGKGRDDVKAALITHQRTKQPSVSLTIRGSSLPDEHVILGGHLDSIALRGRTLVNTAPGADDNASGIGTLTEVARALLSRGFVPERTVTFYGYAAEEVGMIGSADIATAAKNARLKVIGVLQYDMVNYSTAAQPHVALISDNTDAALNQFTTQLVQTYVGIPVKERRCGYACSDHASWTSRGFPSTFPHEAAGQTEGNQKIHTPDDTLALSKNSVSHAMHFAKLGVAYVAELAKGKVATSASTP